MKYLTKEEFKQFKANCSQKIMNFWFDDEKRQFVTKTRWDSKITLIDYKEVDGVTINWNKTSKREKPHYYRDALAGNLVGGPIGTIYGLDHAEKTAGTREYYNHPSLTIIIGMNGRVKLPTNYGKFKNYGFKAIIFEEKFNKLGSKIGKIADANMYG